VGLQAVFNSFLLVFISEMGDKTQLLALVLSVRFRKPLPIMLGIFVATILNHTLASYIGSLLSNQIAPQLLSWILGVVFIIFGLWILIPDKEEEFKKEAKWGAFLTTTVAFFFAEMGDKTQLATLALGAKYASATMVTIGSTLGMLVADGLAVYFGQKFNNKIPLKIIRLIASILFILFGISIIIGF